MKRCWVGFFFLAALSAVVWGQSLPADLVLSGGVVYTVDDRGSKAQAVAVRDGRIAAVGTAAQIAPWIGAGTRVVDTSGLAVYPGFIDSHAHLIAMGFAQRSLDVGDVKTYDELVARVAEKAKNLAPGEWIVGGGWHQSKWKSAPSPEVRGFPTHDALSAVSPENPVFLTHASGHAALANARAMQVAGITSASADPEGGEIIRDAAGNPTGVLVEGASNLVGRYLPVPDEEYLTRVLESALQECLENGITTVQDAASDRGAVALYQKLLDAGRLPVRLNVMLVPGREGQDQAFLEEWFQRGPLVGAGGGFLTIRTVKVFVDGALGSRGAWLSAPYVDDPGNSGQGFPTIGVLPVLAARALGSGFQVATHAIGDRANHEVLDIYERVLQDNPSAAGGARFRIEHAQHLLAADIPRFGQLGVIASMQGIHMASDISWAIDRLGPERIAEGAYVWRKLLDSGAVVANGTDAPVEPIDPIANFYASVTRRTREGRVFAWSHPEQAMTREQALRSYTAAGAYAAFEENFKGSIEAGKVADFTVLTQDIMTVPETRILETRVAYTIVDGNIEYSSHDR
jgi:predicted amidohydrolase YtcJ